MASNRKGGKWVPWGLILWLTAVGGSVYASAALGWGIGLGFVIGVCLGMFVIHMREESRPIEFRGGRF